MLNTAISALGMKLKIEMPDLSTERSVRHSVKRPVQKGKNYTNNVQRMGGKGDENEVRRQRYPERKNRQRKRQKGINVQQSGQQFVFLFQTAVACWAKGALDSIWIGNPGVGWV